MRHPIRPAFCWVCVGGHCALESGAVNVAGIVKVALAVPVEEDSMDFKSPTSASSNWSSVGTSSMSSLACAITTSVLAGRPAHETLIVDPGSTPLTKPPLPTPLNEQVAVAG